MKISALTLLLLLEPLGFVFANTPKNAAPAVSANSSLVRGDAPTMSKTFEMANRRSTGSKGTKAPRKPKKSSTKS
jgi:hypothetical protein